MIEITERATFSGGRIEAKEHVVRGVAVLRRRKPGGLREYTPGALEEVAHLVNGKKAYMNQATPRELNARRGVRDIRDVLGYFENGRVDGDTVRADLHYLENHKAMMKSMSRAPHIVELALHAWAEPGGVTARPDRVNEVNSIAKVEAVSLVPTEGTDKGLFESKQETGVQQMSTYAETRESYLRACGDEKSGGAAWILETQAEYLAAAGLFEAQEPEPQEPQTRVEQSYLDAIR